MIDRDSLKKNIKETIKLLELAMNTLERSYQECLSLNLASRYSTEELNWDEQKDIESLTARFARTSDIYVQKFLKMLDIFELTPEGSIIDRLNRAEKRGYIQSSKDFIRIRDLRNDISHDYLPEEIFVIFKEVIVLCPVLIDSFKQCIKSLRL